MLTFRLAQESDLEEVRELTRRTISSCYPAFKTEQAVNWYINTGGADREIDKYFEFLTIALKDERIIGFTIFFDNLIHLMMVDVHHQRQGYGEALLHHAEQSLAKGGQQQIHLEVTAGNNMATFFLLKNEWEVESTRGDLDMNVEKVFFRKNI